MFDLNKITRENISALKPYSSARSEYKGDAKIWLDANENPFESGLNRYPDPLQLDLKKVISDIKNVPVKNIFIGNGSDEAIDLLFRAFCEPSASKAFIFTPTYGMYAVSAAINNIELVSISLKEDFELPDLQTITPIIKKNTGLLFICSPNNPTGNSYTHQQIEAISSTFSGIVVVDEAYIDFSEQVSAVSILAKHPNVVIIQTLSKAYGLAGARIGMAFANPDIIAILNKIKPPYNINTLSIKAALETLKKTTQYEAQKIALLAEKSRFKTAIEESPLVEHIYPSDANFLLIKFKNAGTIYHLLLNEGIVVRDRTKEIENCLRITIGTKEENNQLINLLIQ
ncbi:histidinol-phosphate transaminase [Crocinitomix catalasitica]|uniref:histidinol-phosphate transaminase n=1 Tax=Crocinitomix catalasitica TaxID=184607 RepID=UPI000480F598|nr:histidinol-phosphate transaminase [Crocinitomix catalasitica]